MRDHQRGFGLGRDLEFARGVQALEDFEGSLVWSVGGTGGDQVHEVSTVAAFAGTYGLRLKTRVTGAADGDSILTARKLMHPEEGVVILRCRVCLPDVSEVEQVRLAYYWMRAAGAPYFLLQLLPATGAVGIWVPPGEYSNFDGFGWALLDGQWFDMELVGDVEAERYVSVMVNGERAEADVACAVGTNLQGFRYAYGQVRLEANAEAPAEMYVDSLLVSNYASV